MPLARAHSNSFRKEPSQYSTRDDQRELVETPKDTEMSQLDQDEKLIIEVQQYPGLYDQNSYDYRDLRKKERMWQNVADSLGLHAKECQARWRVLRDKFVREMRKNVNPKKAGSSALQVYQGSWPLMSQLMFLTSHVKHKPVRPNTKEVKEVKELYSDPGGTDEEVEEIEEEEVELEPSEDDEDEVVDLKTEPSAYVLTDPAPPPHQQHHFNPPARPSQCATPPDAKRAGCDAKFDADKLANSPIPSSEMEMLRMNTKRMRYDAEKLPRYDSEKQTRYDVEKMPRYDVEKMPRYDAEKQSRYDAEKLPRYDAEKQSRYDAEKQSRYDAEKLASSSIPSSNMPSLELEILRMLVSLQSSRQEDEENEERLFCLSLVPALRRLSSQKRSLAKLQIQKVLHVMEYPDLKFDF